MAILFSIDGVKETRRFLGTAVSRMRDPRVALKLSGEELLVRNAQRLRRGVDVEGRPIKKSGRVNRQGGQTLVDRGAYAASWNYQVPDGKTLDYFSSDKRARVLRGDIPEIKPKNGKFLTIPLRARGGLFEGAFGGVDVKGNRTGARAGHYDAKSTFVKRFGSRLYVMQRTEGGRLRAIFLLLKSVKTVKRDVPGIGSSDMTMVVENIGSHVAQEKR